MLSDEERQHDEIFALQNICDAGEFKYIRNTNIECSFSVSCNLVNTNLLIKFNDNFERRKLYVQYLPPIHFYLRLPKNYPSTNPPQYYVAINWLTPWQASLICQKLDELWQENKFNEILFIWYEFLKNEVLTYISLTDILDISYLFDLYQTPENKYLVQIFKWTDPRAIYGGLNLNPVEKLLDYNNFRDLFEFQTSFHECSICFIIHSGTTCMKVNVCNHIFCKNCISQFITMKINEQNVNNIKCPGFDCKINLQFNQIKEICSPEMFEKYKKHLLENRLLSKKNLVYCPRKICQNPVIVKNGNNLASCTICDYNFCAYCFKVYHGVAACDIDLEETLKLINEYKNGDDNKKLFLEKKYGKHQIKQIVHNQLTKDYLRENTKMCPTCGSFTTKISGCNLMSCLYCHTNFCWLCNTKIISEDTYDHFKSTATGPCVGRLFEGIEELNESDEINEFYENDEIYHYNVQNLKFITIHDFE